MAYRYEDLKELSFDDQGQRLFLKVRDTVNKLFLTNTVVMMEDIFKDVSGHLWDVMACVDRMKELGEIREVSRDEVMGQHRIFIKK